MGLAEKEGDGKNKKSIGIAIAAILIAFVFLLAVGAVAYLYLEGGSQEKSGATTTVQTPSGSPEKPSTTVEEKKVTDILKPITRIISGLTGPVNCSNDTGCYHETAKKCVKSETTYQTLQATQLRKVLGEKDGKCIIYFENVDINKQLTTDKWLGLNMTCLIKPEDTGKDILTEVNNPQCSGSLWDALKPYVKK